MSADARGHHHALVPTAFGMLLIALFSRALAGLLAIGLPVATETGARITPLQEVVSADYLFYKKYANAGFGLLAAPIHSVLETGTLDGWISSRFVPGPLFPWLLQALRYSETPVVLSSLYLLASALLVYGWAIHYRRAGIAVFWQVALAFFPLLIYYALVPTPDLLLAGLVFCLYMLLNDDKPVTLGVYIGSATVLLLAILVRPNALALAPVAMFALVRNKRFRWDGFSVALTAVLTAAVAYLALYYIPYFRTYETASAAISYWGVEQSRYWSGLFESLPAWIDRPVSVALLFVSKLVYVCGLRPSYSDAPAFYVALRAVSGLWLLPGILWCMVRAHPFDRVLVLCFVLPLLIGASQERYLLPIFPLLLLHGVLFWKGLARWRPVPKSGY